MLESVIAATDHHHTSNHESAKTYKRPSDHTKLVSLSLQLDTFNPRRTANQIIMRANIILRAGKSADHTLYHAEPQVS
jgi:hypothetical protein